MISFFFFLLFFCSQKAGTPKVPPRQRHRLRYNTESDIYIHFRSSARIVRPRRSLFISFSCHREIPHCRSPNSSMWGRRARGGGGGFFLSFSAPFPPFSEFFVFPALSSPSPLAQSTPPKPLHHPTPILIFHSLPGWDPVLAPTPRSPKPSLMLPWKPHLVLQ